jgi:hypothetical protein
VARVFYLGAPSYVRLPNTASASELLKATGNNTGNLLIGHALKRQLKIDSFGGMSADSKYVEENFDYIIIGAANFLFKNFDLSFYADFLERINLPCVIIGLGAQAPSYEDKLVIPEGTKRTMKIISERSTTLGVRGHFTASVLEALGITNVRVIGCPSMYWTCKSTMSIPRKPFDACKRIALNGSADTVVHMVDVAAAVRVESLLANLAFKNNYPYILQNEAALMAILFGTGAKYEKGLIPALKKMYGLSDISDEDFIRFVKSNMLAFFNIEEWMDYIRSFDLVIGTRFHGCLIALLNGIPSVIFVIDARTREMCELLKIPHVDIRNIATIDLRVVYEAMDLTALQNAYSIQYQNYIDFLEENRIEHCLERHTP